VALPRTPIPPVTAQSRPYRPVPPFRYSRARSNTGSLPASTSSTVQATGNSGRMPTPATSSPFGNAWRVTESCTAQFLGSGSARASPGLPAEVSPMITPDDVFFRQRVHPRHDHAVGEGVDLQLGRIERPAVIE